MRQGEGCRRERIVAERRRTAFDQDEAGGNTVPSIMPGLSPEIAVERLDTGIEADSIMPVGERFD